MFVPFCGDTACLFSSSILNSIQSEMPPSVNITSRRPQVENGLITDADLKTMKLITESYEQCNYTFAGQL